MSRGCFLYLLHESVIAEFDLQLLKGPASGRQAGGSKIEGLQGLSPAISWRWGVLAWPGGGIGSLICKWGVERTPREVDADRGALKKMKDLCRSLAAVLLASFILPAPAATRAQCSSSSSPHIHLFHPPEPRNPSRFLPLLRLPVGR